VLIAPFGSNAPLWSLANEFWYYIWFPILLILFRTRKVNLLLLAVLVVSAIVCRALLPLFACWLLGSAVFFGVRWAQRKGIALRHGRLLVLFGFSAFLIGEAAAHLVDLPYLVSAFGIALGFAIFLTTLLITRTGLPSLFSGVARYGAESSFSLYVAHYPLLLMAMALSTPGAGQAPGLLPLLYSLALMAGLVLAGWLVSWLTERNTAKVRTWGRGLFAQRRPPAEAAPVPSPAHEQ
jgi:peptidoglycan/LPS O-acetylase OafA/YrhL